jgi:sucrose phosphorylase
MVTPEIHEFLDWATAAAGELGVSLLPEVHDLPATHAALVERGLWTYDFVLPGLVLHSLLTGEADRLVAHLARSPHRQVTTLDCHDGIPVRPDLEGILAPEEMRGLADAVVRRGGNVNRILSSSHAADGVDVHQLNVTYFSALGADEDRYLTARAIQLFARGIPQVYYVGMLAGANDTAGVAETGEGRAINRHDYTPLELEEALTRPVVQRLMALIRLRNTHAAFDGELRVTGSGSTLRMGWEHEGSTCELEADLASGRCVVRASAWDARQAPIPTPTRATR